MVKLINRENKRRAKKKDIYQSLSLSESGSVVAKGMYSLSFFLGYPVGGVGELGC